MIGLLEVEVELMNDEGAILRIRAFGETVDDAVANAEGQARRLWQDDTYVMNETRPA